MIQHELKIWPQYFDDIDSGKKPFEIRKNDREFKVGDTLLLREWIPTAFLGNKIFSTGLIRLILRGRKAKGYTGRQTAKKVTYVLEGGQFGIELGYAVLGITKF